MHMSVCVASHKSLAQESYASMSNIMCEQDLSDVSKSFTQATKITSAEWKKRLKSSGLGGTKPTCQTISLDGKPMGRCFSIRTLHLSFIKARNKATAHNRPDGYSKLILSRVWYCSNRIVQFVHIIHITGQTVISPKNLYF